MIEIITLIALLGFLACLVFSLIIIAMSLHGILDELRAFNECDECDCEDEEQPEVGCCPEAGGGADGS